MTLPFIKLFQQKKKSTIFLWFITPPPFPLEAFLVIDELLRAPLVAQRVKCLPPMQKTRVRSLQCRRPGFDPWVRKIPWRRKWQPTSVLLPGKFHGLRSLIGYSLWGCKESDTTEQLHFPSIRVFSNELALHIKWPKYCYYHYWVRNYDNAVQNQFVSF